MQITNNQILRNAIIQTGNGFPKEVTQAISTDLLSQYVSWTAIFAQTLAQRITLQQLYSTSQDRKQKLLSQILAVVNNLSGDDYLKFRRQLRLNAAFAIDGLSLISSRYPANTCATGYTSPAVVNTMVGRVSAQ